MEDKQLIQEIIQIIEKNQYNLGKESNKSTVTQLLDLLEEERGLKLGIDNGKKKYC
jgi:hypothetical protein